MLYFSQKRMKGSVTQGRHFVSKSGKCLSKWFANHDDQAAMDSVGNDRRETHEKREALSRSAQMEGWTVGTVASGILSLLVSAYHSPGTAPGPQVLEKMKTGF